MQITGDFEFFTTLKKRSKNIFKKFENLSKLHFKKFVNNCTIENIYNNAEYCNYVENSVIGLLKR